MNRVEVSWFDAHATAAGWTDVDELDVSVRFVTTVGLLVKRDDYHLYVALSHDPETSHVDSVVKIPNVCVQKVTYLRAQRGRFWRWGST